MPRQSNLPPLRHCDDYPVAPHRYLWHRTKAEVEAEVARTTWAEVRDAAPYKPGEVVYVVWGDGFARAYVHAITCRRDGFGDLAEAYEIRRETKAGHWAKRVYTVGAGLVQRGYQRAGLAPDVPEKF